LPEREPGGSGEFQDNDLPSGTKNPAHFRQAGREILKVACPEGNYGSIERPGVEPKVFRFTVLESNEVLHSPFFHLLPSPLQHLICNVDAHNLNRMKLQGCNGEIGSSRCDVENSFRLDIRKMLNGMAPPIEVNPATQEMVQQVVTVRNGIKQRTDVVFLHQKCIRRT
jgi:hypothetical protein